MLDRLESQRQAAVGALDDMLSQDRYLKLLDRLNAAAQRPPFLSGENISPQMEAGIALAGLIVDPCARAAATGPQSRARTHGSSAASHSHQGKAAALRPRRPLHQCSASLQLGPRRPRSNCKSSLARITMRSQPEVWLESQSGIGNAPQHSTLPAPTAFEAGRLATEQRERQNELRRRWPQKWKKVQKSMRALGVSIAPHSWTAVSGRSEILSTSNIVELPSPIKKPLTLHTTKRRTWPRGVPDNIAARPPRFLHEVVEHGDAALVISAIQVGHVLVPPCGYEGIQPFEGVDVLVDLGCDYGPGYAIKPASPAEDLDFGMQRANEIQTAQRPASPR